VRNCLRVSPMHTFAAHARPSECVPGPAYAATLTLRNQLLCVHAVPAPDLPRVCGARAVAWQRRRDTRNPPSRETGLRLIM